MGTKKELAQAKNALESAKYAKSFSVDNVVACLKKVDDLERGLKTLDAMEKELF